jgi:hypothetical protein
MGLAHSPKFKANALCGLCGARVKPRIERGIGNPRQLLEDSNFPGRVGLFTGYNGPRNGGAKVYYV